MKLLIQNSLFFPKVIGGAEISSHLLGVELRRRGLGADAVASTGVVGNGKSISTRPTDDGLGTVFEAPAHGYCDLLPEDPQAAQPGILMRGLHHFSSVHSRRWQTLFAEILETSQPDIVHTNTLVGLTPAIWGAAHQRGIPVVHTLRDYHLLCPRTTLLRSDNTDCQSPPLPCRILAGLKMSRTKGVQVVTGPTRFVLQKHLDAGGFPDAVPEVVANALEDWPDEIPHRNPEDPVRGLFLGQLNVHKGIPVLLEVLSDIFADPAYAHLGFDFAGAGPLVDTVKAFCDAHSQQARYHGVVKGQDKRDLLAQASFMVVPSVWSEPFSRSIIDGFSFGLPAIGSNRGGIPEVITDGSDGQISPPDFASLGKAMRTYAGNPELRLQHGAAARLRAADFTLDRQVDKFLVIYERLLERRATPS